MSSLPQPAPAAPRRSAATYRARRLAVATVLAGAVLGVASLFGPVGLVRAGVALAVVTGLVAAWLLVRELGRTTRRHGDELADLSRRSAEALRAERVREREVLDVIDVRTEALKSRIAGLTGDLGETRRRLADAEASVEQLTGTLAEREERLAERETQLAERDGLLAAREETVAELRAHVLRLETELAALRAEAEADVVALPRRRGAHQAKVARRA